ncbi:hypothetical protein [Rubrivirga sp. IMCC45206]|uniref:hypothetical protein n=1 Tax=Rubrivirga sp. IMCC45206 TaxID=3391614 RepID=UPI00398FC8C8
MRAVLLAAALLLSAAASAQTDDWPAADPADVASIDAILSSVYAVISGPATEARDWDRFLSMMHPEARLIPTGVGADGVGFARVMTPHDYIEVVGPVFRDSPMFQGKGFYEVEAARRVERYGSIAHVWSTYESRLDPAEAPFARGINSFQLFWDGRRWHVLSIFWHQEDDATPIPAPYLEG